MGQAIRQINRRRHARDTIRELVERADQVIAIHYSCESFYDRPDGTSPRITSIAVRYLDTKQTTSFSIHQMAERMACDLTALEQHYDQLEKQMLDEFHEFVSTHLNYKWLHWNMRDMNYGFAAIAHRHRVLKGKPVTPHNSKLCDLSALLIDIYGTRYIAHPRLENLVVKNKVTNQDFLNGKEEAEAFERRDYVKLHQSTLRKVDILHNILLLEYGGQLRTDAKWKDHYGYYPQAIGEWIRDKWWISLVIIALSILSDILGIVDIFPWK